MFETTTHLHLLVLFARLNVGGGIVWGQTEVGTSCVSFSLGTLLVIYPIQLFNHFNMHPYKRRTTMHSSCVMMPHAAHSDGIIEHKILWLFL